LSGLIFAQKKEPPDAQSGGRHVIRTTHYSVIKSELLSK